VSVINVEAFIVEGSIALLKVAEIVVFTATAAAALAGVTETTAGGSRWLLFRAILWKRPADTWYPDLSAVTWIGVYRSVVVPSPN
jgi:hypothetical protein